MFKHKKSISMVTLIVFLLVTLLATPGMALAAKSPAEKAPASKGSITKPSMDSAGGNSNSNGTDTGEKVQNGIIRTPYIETIKINSNLVAGFQSDNSGPYHVYLPGSVASVTLDTDPIDYTDYIKITAPNYVKEHGHLLDCPINDYKTSDTIPLLGAGQNTTINIELRNYLLKWYEAKSYSIVIHRAAAVTGISITPDSLIMKKGTTAQVSANIAPPLAWQEIVWNSSANAVATVAAGANKTATVTAQGVGEAVVSATGDGGVKSDPSCEVTVIPADAIMSLQETLVGTCGNTAGYNLTAEIMSGDSPCNVPDSAFQWETADTTSAIITMTEQGKTAHIVPQGVGSTTIRAFVELSDGTVLEKVCEVSVVDPIEVQVIKGPKLNQNGIYVATFGYKCHYPGGVTIQLGSDNVLTGGGTVVGDIPTTFVYSPNKFVEAFTVKYYQNDGPQKWSVTYDGVSTSDIAGIGEEPAITVSPNPLDIIIGGQGTLTATVDSGEIVPPSNRVTSLVSDITWKIIEGEGVISLAKKRGRTCEITGLEPGVATIQATFSSDPGYTTTCQVRVWDIKLDINNLPAMPMTVGGNTRNIYALIDPANVKHNWTVTWKTDDETESVISIATGSNALEGVITPRNAGSAQVWAELNVDGAIVTTEKYEVTVVDPLELKIVEAPQPINEDGTYEVTFGYVSHYPGEVSADISWIEDNYELIGDDEIIHYFNPESSGTFTVSYFHGQGPLTWYVTYDGVTSEVSTGDVDEENGGELDDEDVGISVNSLDPMDAWSSPQQLKAVVKDLNMLPRALNAYIDEGEEEYPGINWTFQVKVGDEWVDGVGNVIGYDTDEGTTVNIQPRDPGQVKATASFNGVSDSCIITVSDPRTITLNPTSLELKKKRDPGTIVATINGIPMIPDGEESGYDWEQVYWNSSNGTIASIAAEGTTCIVNPLNKGYATITASLDNGKAAACAVKVKSTSNNNSVLETEEPLPAALPEIPAPAALDTFDVTITVGSNQAIVNGEQLTLGGNTLLIGVDRVMVDYADVAKLIPGLQVVWDWKTLSVTFSKDGKELKMVLDQVPADFDTPFMNIGGRLVVPVRYVGAFFDATVDWIGNTLVVHMYK